MENVFSNINPYAFTGSAVIIGLFLTKELSLEEQGTIGNWLQLVGLVIQTYASQKELTESNDKSKEDDMDTIKKAIQKIQEQLNKL